MALALYGIPNCDTVRKARRWLDDKGIDYAFHDLKNEMPDRETVERWAGEAGWHALLNRRSTTYRSLDKDEVADLDQERAIDLMLQHPTLIKRPVAEREDQSAVLVGFTQSIWENAFC